MVRTPLFRRLGRPAPDLPVTDLARAEAGLEAVPAGRAGEPVKPRGPVRERRLLTDHGAALLLQGDMRRAAAVFRMETESAPDRPGGYRNLARTALAAGHPRRALHWLREAEGRAPSDPRNAFFFARACRAVGDLERVRAAIEACLAAFPRDRGSFQERGIIRFLSGNFRGALDSFDAVLEIDPEEVNAHYHRMKCYEGLGDTAEAAARRAYLHYKADDNAPKRARRYLASHEAANREAQKIHVHR